MKTRTSLIFLLCILTFALSLGGCSNRKSTPQVVTTLYPIQFVASELLGDGSDVANITPVGVEPHDYELSPDDSESIMSAKLVIVMGYGFQPAVEKAASARTTGLVEVLPQVLGSIDRDEIDPHVWIDPVLMKDIVDVVATQLIKEFPSREKDIESNKVKLDERLDELNSKYEEGLTSCSSHTFVTTHNAFARLASRYGLTQKSISGVSPESEPTPDHLSELADFINENDITTVFTEDFVSDKAAKTLAEETGAEVKELSPIEGLEPEDVKAGRNYIDVMEDNLTALREALSCS